MSSQISKIVVGLLILLLFKNKVNCESSVVNDDTGVRKMELYDGVFLKIPEYKNGTKKLLSFEIDTRDNKETGKFVSLKYL